MPTWREMLVRSTSFTFGYPIRPPSLSPVSVVVADPLLCERQAILVPSLRDDVEVLIGGVEHVDSARKRRVRVEDVAVQVFVEHAGAFAVGETRLLRSEVIDVRAACDFFRAERCPQVVVEIPVVGGEPREGPPHPLPERLDLRRRRARDSDKRHIALIQVNDDLVEVVRPERAVWTTLVPLRREHEVIDNELAPPTKELGESHRSLGTLEDILLLDFLPRQFAPLPAQFIAELCEFLLLRQKRFSRRQPLVV